MWLLLTEIAPRGIVKYEKLCNTGNLVILVVHQRSAVRGEIACSVQQRCPLWHVAGIGGK